MKRLLSSILIPLFVLCCFLPASPVAQIASSADTLPAALDLTGSTHLPPIANQGGVGACVSMAGTYMQLSNAYSRYLHELDPNTSWNPSTGNAAYVFAPRFTFNLGGGSTAAVYRILQEQGALTQTYAQFSGGVTGAAAYNALALDWATVDGYWEHAQNYRIKNFDQVWLIDSNGQYFDGISSGTGLDLINRVKQNLNEGNVVVTGGYPSRWVTDLVTISNTGTYGKSGDKAIPYSTNVSSGGHQVAIIGYDDNITCVKNGVTLKGAFKIANSWGTGWQNSGCVWMMYDALNGAGQSPYSALNVSNRIWTMDQFVFLDYRTDLNYSIPELMAKVQINTADRDNFALTLKRYDPESGEMLSHMPIMFSEHSRPEYNEGYGFYGAQNGAAKDGYLVVNFDYFTQDLPQGKTVDDYLWGIEVSYVQTDSGKTPSVKSVELLRNGTSVYKKSSFNDAVTSTNSKTYMLTAKKAVNLDIPKGVSIAAVNGTTFVETAGTTVYFTVDVQSGYKVSNYLNVFFNGTRVLPVDGVYAIKLVDGDALNANVLKIEGVLKKAQTVIDLGNYGDGFENPYGSYWMLMTVPVVDGDADLTDMAAIDAGTYKYTIRMTLDGVTYNFKPQSHYNFGSRVLFRINVADQGFFPTLGTKYTTKVEFCYKNVAFYVDDNFTVTCKLSPSSDTMTAHTHSFTGEQIAINTSTCNVAGNGYVRCSCAGCTALQAVTLPLDTTAHVFSSELIVTKNATRHELGEYSAVCTVCGATTFAGNFEAASGDATGDNQITIDDVTVMLAILSKSSSAPESAGNTDVNGDGFFNIKDITYMLLILAGRITI